MHTYTPVNITVDGPIRKNNPLSTLCFLIEIFPRAHAKGKKRLNYLKFGTFIGRFPSDGMASMAVKVLIRQHKTCATFQCKHLSQATNTLTNDDR